MKRYILIANEAKDVSFLYADFASKQEMSMLLFEYTRQRIGLIRALDVLKIKNSKIIYKLIFQKIFQNTIDNGLINSDNDEKVFIIMARAYEKYGINLVAHLREKYPSCKIVLYLTDLIRNMRFSIDKAKGYFDVVCSFDKGEAEANNLGYVMEPFSSILLSKIPNREEPQFDVTFVGAAKGRYEKIMSLYNTLSNKGLTCEFYIVGVEKEKQIKAKGIHYDEYLDFEKVLMEVAKSRCVVEIMQEGGYSATTRYAEAMLFKKNLITDCPALKNSKEKGIIYFDNETVFNPNEIRMKNEIDTIRFTSYFSIDSFINSMETHLMNCECV